MRPGLVLPLIAAVLSAHGLYLARASAGRAAAEELEDATRLHLERLRDAPEEPYLRDRARRITGQTITPDGLPIPDVEVLACRVLDLILAIRQSATGMAAVLEVVPPVRPVGESDTAGNFEVLGPGLGQWLLFFRAPGYAPARRSGVLVRDGIVAGEMGFILERASGWQLLHDLPDDTLEVHLVYASWWPDLRWTCLDRGELVDCDRRLPDGAPLLVAVRGADTPLRFLKIPTEIEPAACVPLSTLEEWDPDCEALYGWPSIAESMPAALSFASGRCAREPVASPTGEVAAMADFGSATLSIQLSSGEELMALADVFGETVFQDLPPGLHLVRARMPGLQEWTWPLGVSVSAGRRSRVRLFGVDSPQDFDRDSLALFGFVCEEPERAVDGFVYCQSVAGHPEGFFQRDETRPHGFYRYVGLVPAAVYNLIYCRGEAPENFRHVKTIVACEDPSQRLMRMDLPIPAGSVDAHLPFKLRAKDGVTLKDADEPARRSCYVPIEQERDEVVFRGVEPGKYRCEIHRDDQLLASSTVVEVGALPTAIEASAWTSTATPAN